MRKKYQLPAFASLDQISIDLPRLQKAADDLVHCYTDVCSANPKLCEYHPSLVDKVYDNFDQINLTVHNGLQEVGDATESKKARLRRNQNIKEEGFFNKPTPEYTGSYFEKIVSQFSHDAMRVRITRLNPGAEIPLHIDYDPTYATRVIVPIYSNDLVINRFKVKKDIIDGYLAPGKAWFLNTGFAHGVLNTGLSPRIALMFSLDGQDDLKTI